MKTVTRFAPSPSGYLHLGHAYAALEARRLADVDGGEMRLRIEDIDAPRCDPLYDPAIRDDLTFLGITWDGPVLVQSGRMAAYQDALEALKQRDLVYPCYLSRRQLDSLLSAPHPRNTDRLVDPEDSPTPAGQAGEPAWRLRMEAAEPILRGLDFTDMRHGGRKIDFSEIGDEVIARKDIATSYHLSVVVDDAASGVTLVTRGEDLLPSTPLHRILQELLGLPETRWWHHPVMTDPSGRRLSKRAGDISLNELRAAGLDRAAILTRINESNFSSILTA
ncbi:MAG: tRNA glutamyl-Q(34) synthetase GluQRS [Candidatus Puniceispirillales bacterium]